MVLAGCAALWAQTGSVNPSQERYSDLLERTAPMPAYEALYHMMAYQRFHPSQAPVYYRMGDVIYGLLPDKDPLHDYDERAELLYKGRLFYGNCLHFMGGKLPHGETFPTVTPAGKRVEYEDVDAYMRGRLDTLNRWRAETDTLHNRFYRMVDSYELCRQLFLQFMQKYPSEKLAHLCFTQDDLDNLRHLEVLTRQFEQDKRLFTEALQVSPIKHYSPDFRSVSIAMYRLDGVTSTDFLANDIPVWNYGEWTKSFLEVQEKTYLAMFRTIVEEYKMITFAIDRFRTNQIVQLTPDQLLPYLVERYDYQSPVATFIRLNHLVAETLLQAADSLTADEQISNADLSGRITASLVARERTEEVRTLCRTMQQQINESTAAKYAYVLKRTELASVDGLTRRADELLALQQQLTELIDRQLHNYAAAFPKQFEDVDISDDRAASEAAEAAN